MPKVAVLHLGGPLQSWASYSVIKMRVDTQQKPGDRAIRGLVAAAFGVHRGSDLPEVIKNMSIDVKVNKRGRVIRDYQTISAQDSSKRPGARPHDDDYYLRVGRILAKGASKPTKLVLTSAQVIERTYLADASFIVLLKGRTDAETEEIQAAMQNPVWSPYLGRKAFPPTFPFLLGIENEEEAESSAKAKLKKVEETLDDYIR